MISPDEIKVLYERYGELIRLEIDEFGVTPTEVRHLIGRFGEFYCAIKVGGQLAHQPNQMGFDVISPDGKRISVKTTAQKSGFVLISPTTLNLVDKLMVLQYQAGEIVEVYYGDIKPAIDVSRIYDYSGKYELDISKARKLA